MKPNLNFLAKVRDQKVRSVFDYSPRAGGRYSFRGGEATAKRHAAAGFINMPGGAWLGQPGIATLTEAGKLALGDIKTSGEK